MKARVILATMVIMATMISGLAVAGGQREAAGEREIDSLVLGMVPSREVSRMIESIDPLTQLLEAELGIPVQGTVLTSFTGVIEAMGTGRVDIGIFGPFALVLGEQQHDLQIILNSLRRGSDHYRAQFVVRQDAGINEISDLRGRTMAFVDPASASGFLFPYVFLLNNGIDPDTDLADYIFAGAHDAAVSAVMSGDVDVAVSFEDAREDLLVEFPTIMEETMILTYTDEIPNDGVAVRPGIPAELREAIAEAFITIGNTSEGQQLLSTLYNVTGYIRADSERYAVVRQTFEVMEEYIDF